MPILKDRIEFRVIGTDEQLARAAQFISDSYVIHYQSDLYSCKDRLDLHRQYYKVTEKEDKVDEQDD